MATTTYTKSGLKELTVRSALLSDIDEIHSIEQSAYSNPWSSNVLLDCFKPNYWFLTLLYKDQIVGYSIVSNIVGEAHLLNLCIGKKFSGLGFGQFLLDKTVLNCKTQECASMLLEVRASNTSAIYIYRKFGFIEIGVRKNYYPSGEGREDAIVFSLVLDQSAIDEHV